MKSILVLCIVTLATSSPIPQRLTEEDFGRSFDEDGLSRENNKVDIFSGYAKVSFNELMTKVATWAQLEFNDNSKL